MNLAQLQQLAQTNPAALTPQQFAALQSAGTIASTVPYSSAPQLATPAAAGAIDPQCVAAGMTGGPYPNCTALPSAAGASLDFSQPYAGIPLWGWIAGGGLVLILVLKKK